MKPKVPPKPDFTKPKAQDLKTESKPKDVDVKKQKESDLKKFKENRESSDNLKRKESLDKFKNITTKTTSVIRATNSKGKLNRNIKNPVDKPKKPKVDLDEIKRVDSIDSLRAKTGSVPKLTDLLPSATTVVSSTTSTVTQPLKIEAKFDQDQSKTKVTPMYLDEGRVLSATSVSSAINRMNDTVLDTRTLMSDRGYSKLSPAANAIISMSKEDGKKPEELIRIKGGSELGKYGEFKTGDGKTIGEFKGSDLKTNGGDVKTNSGEVKTNSGEVKTNTGDLKGNTGDLKGNTGDLKGSNLMGNSGGLKGTAGDLKGKAGDAGEVGGNTNGIKSNNGELRANGNDNHSTNKVFNSDNSLGLGDVNNVRKSANDRLMEARTIVAADVKPLQINVKEKPMEILVQSGNVREKPMELLVQSGNVRFPSSATNGISSSTHG